MTKVELTYNPYKVLTEIVIDGEKPKKNSKLIQFLDKRLQLWVDEIPMLLSSEANDTDFELVFHGTVLDYQDLVTSVNAAKRNGLNFIVKHKKAKEFGSKEIEIKELFKRIQKLPLSELQSPVVANAFENAFNELLEVNVVATMSAGKSTLINALLGKKLMPSKQGACTATITKIQDDDDSNYETLVYNKDKKEIIQYPSVDYSTMVELNKNPDVSEIHIKGDIPFVSAEEVSLVLIDTPGPDNARDPRHGQVTAEALDHSSKMLVMFVMNGGNLHNTAQDNLLREIAKSMSVGGKQSKERFLFVINRLDEYEEDDDDIAGETIPDTIKYLEEMGIKDPNIFPAAALPALLIRQFLNTTDIETRKKLEVRIKGFAEKSMLQKQLHLEKYAQLPGSCQQIIDNELKDAIDNNDIVRQALVHTGIRGIEETIRMYVTKYCRPAKITNVVDTFKQSLESAESFTRVKKEIASRKKDLNEIQEQMKELKATIDSQKGGNEEFKRVLRSVDIQKTISDKLLVLSSVVVTDLKESLSDCPAEMKEQEALDRINSFKNLANRKQGEFSVEVNKIIYEDIKSKSDYLINYYLKKLESLSITLGGDLRLDLGSYVKGELANIDSDSVLDESVDTRVEKRIEHEWKTVRKKRSGLDRLLHPTEWFDPYYTEKVKLTIEKDVQVAFINREKLMNQLIAPITARLTEENRRVLKFAAVENSKIIDYFDKQFNRVDMIIEAKVDELIKETASETEAQKALAESERILVELNSINEKLNNILEI